MRKEAKDVRELINAVRMGCACGVYTGAISSTFLAGILVVVVVAIDVLYLNDASIFGTRQWSIALSLVVIIALSLAMLYALKENCGDLLTSDSSADDTGETAEAVEAVGIDGADDGFSVLLEIIASVLTCLITLAWLGGMWGFCYAAGEMDDAGFSVAEVTGVETLVAIVLGVTLSRFCKRGTH